ncbi:hypothetical protein CRUP_002230 [Coryphaenoides rupestris]|nr:hypothetical protein CRUP_002230 [Coryphaenoides rupestris]
MENADSTDVRRRELPPLPLQDSGHYLLCPDHPVSKSKKKRSRKLTSGVDGVEDPGVELEGALPSQRASQADLVNGDGLDGHATDAQETESKMADAQLPTDLELEEDDIITDALLPPLSQQALFSAPLSASMRPIAVTHRVSGGSVGGDHHHRWQPTTSRPPPPSPAPVPTGPTRDVALRVHGGFR